MFKLPEVTDSDIGWATCLLKLPEGAFYGKDLLDPRQEVLKLMGNVDVAACPGSGKTTLLVAKLAILAEKWRYRTAGICVLSHTNVARNEIETRLGHSNTGRRLLSYPHYIGTIHGFVNEFLAMPWVRSLGYPINMIDTDVCLMKRWKELPFATRSGLEKNRHGPTVLSMKSSDFSPGQIRWGTSVLGQTTETYRHIQSSLRKSTSEGYFCYDEMFMWARDLMDHVPDTTGVIRERFPLLFIDEAQDNSEEQSEILHRIFMKGDGRVIRQRFGDGNQAIFDSMGAREAVTDKFPDEGIKKDLPDSYRFGQTIANLADPLGDVPYLLKGHGPKSSLASGKSEGQHTIFLFGEDRIDKVLDAYGALLVKTFSEQELRDGIFTAIGQIHRMPEEEKQKLPHHVGNYWSDYDPELTRADPRPKTLAQYVFVGMRRAEISGEAYLCVEAIAEGILRIAGMIEGKKGFPHLRNKHQYVQELLEASAEVGEKYRGLIGNFALKREAPTKDSWDTYWRGIVLTIAETIAGKSMSNPEVTAFLAWKEGGDEIKPVVGIKKSHDNIYRYPSDDPKVQIRVGSIHSVKGETHTATLVLETYWRDQKGRHNLELLLPWFYGITAGGKGIGVQQKSRLKLHYVAITRPAHLLCLAIKKKSVEGANNNIDLEAVRKLETRGWQVESV